LTAGVTIGQHIVTEVPAMWRPMMFLLCLIAALAGSPLRQAEAAGDLARSLAEMEGGDVIEAVDGRVGDDSGETILKADVSASADAPSGVPAIDCHAGPRPPLAVTFPTLGDASSDPRPTSDPARRHAWLQDFRF
jgi:hypothetical protein